MATPNFSANPMRRPLTSIWLPAPEANTLPRILQKKQERLKTKEPAHILDLPNELSSTMVLKGKILPGTSPGRFQDFSRRLFIPRITEGSPDIGEYMVDVGEAVDVVNVNPVDLQKEMPSISMKLHVS